MRYVLYTNSQVLSIIGGRQIKLNIIIIIVMNNTIIHPLCTYKLKNIHVYKYATKYTQT